MYRTKNRIKDILVFCFGFSMIYLVIMTAKWADSLDGDSVPQTYSLFVHAFNSLKKGELPLWNPALWGGFPAYAHPITESLYPINWLLCAVFYNNQTGLVSYQMIAWNLVLHLQLYYFGIYILCRRLNIKRIAAAFAAVVATFNTAVFNHSILSWIVSLDGFCYLPIILYLGVGLINSPDKLNGIRNAIGLGIAFGILGLISISGFLIINAAFLGCLCLFKLGDMILRKDLSMLKIYITRMIIAVIIAVLISSISLIGMGVLLKRVSRYVESEGFMFGKITVPFNDFVKRTDSVSDLQGIFFGSAMNSNLSIMLIGLIFLLIGLFYGNKTYEKLFCVFSLGYVLCYSIGLVFPQIVFWIPGLNAMRHPFFYALFFPLFAGILAGYGLDSFITMINVKTKDKTIMLCLRLVIVCILLANIVSPDMPNGIYKVSAAFLLLATAITFLPAETIFRLRKFRWLNSALSVILVISAACDMIVFYKAIDCGNYSVAEAEDRVQEHIMTVAESLGKYNLDKDGNRIVSWLTTSLPENVSSCLGYEEVIGYLNPGYDKEVKVHLNLPLQKRYALQNIKYVLFSRDNDEETTAYFDKQYPELIEVGTELLFPSYDSLEKENVTIYETDNHTGNAWLVSDIKYYNENTMEDEHIFELINSIELSEQACVNQKNAEGESIMLEKGVVASDTVTMIERNNNSVCYNVSTDGRKLLVTSDNAYPGWNVYIDGEKKNLIEVNYLNRGVIIDKGTHRVEFRFEPIEVKIWFISLILCVFFIGGILVCTKKKKGE